MTKRAYDHAAYTRRLKEAQIQLSEIMSEHMDKLDPHIRKIVLLDELCDPDSPEDGLFWSTYFLVMQRLLHNEAQHWTRVE